MELAKAFVNFTSDPLCDKACNFLITPTQEGGGSPADMAIKVSIVASVVFVLIGMVAPYVGIVSAAVYVPIGLGWMVMSLLCLLMSVTISKKLPAAKLIAGAKNDVEAAQQVREGLESALERAEGAGDLYRRALDQESEILDRLEDLMEEHPQEVVDLFASEALSLPDMADVASKEEKRKELLVQITALRGESTRLNALRKELVDPSEMEEYKSYLEWLHAELIVLNARFEELNTNGEKIK